MSLQIFYLRLLLKEYEEICLKQQYQSMSIQNYEQISQFLSQIKMGYLQDNNNESELQYIKQFFNFANNPQKFTLRALQDYKQEESSDYSDTISLSLINENQQSFDLKNYLDWLQVLEKYGEFFRPVSYFRSYIKANKFQHILNNIKSFQVIQEGTSLYSGINLQENDWIALREQDVGNNSILESVQQYIIYDLIYKLYPNKFLKLLLPIYIETDQYDKTKFISQIEFGEINLYTYSQQNRVEDEEFQHIFQQIYEQIQLLHKHNIAHRDIKPQNIIYVENKGWLLCDFGDSIQYEQVIGIYSIRGTYAFLLLYLQHKSKIQGIMVKQNLLENDIYALAVTLIFVKYQIKSKADIFQYIKNNNDPIINTLINYPQQDNLSQIVNKPQLQFIRPQIKKEAQIQTLQEIDIHEYIVYISIIQNSKLLVKYTEEIERKILNLINDKLALKDEYSNFINILCYVRLPGYIKQLKNLISYNQLRQCKYWKNLLQKINFQKNLNFVVNQIKFMDHIGLTDITYKTAKLFLQNDYDFSVHIIIIKLLVFFKQQEQAQNELRQIFIYRQFRQMTFEQLTQLLGLVLNNFSWDTISEEEKQQFQTLGFEGIFMDINDIMKKDLTHEDFINQSIQIINKLLLREDKQQSIGQIFNYIEQAMEFKNIFTLLELIEQLKQLNLKCFCTTFHWQKLIQHQIEISRLIENKSEVKEFIKKMNYILIFNSESYSQQQVLRIIKLNVCPMIKNRKKQTNKFQKLKRIIIYYNNLQFKFYKDIVIKELIQMLYQLWLDIFTKEVKVEILLQYFNFLVYLSKAANQQMMFNEQEQIQLFRNFLYIYFRTLNKKRYYQLLVNKNVLIYQLGSGIQTKFRSFDNTVMLKQKKFKTLSRKFLEQQYLEKI